MQLFLIKSIMQTFDYFNLVNESLIKRFLKSLAIWIVSEIQSEIDIFAILHLFKIKCGDKFEKN